MSKFVPPYKENLMSDLSFTEENIWNDGYHQGRVDAINEYHEKYSKIADIIEASIKKGRADAIDEFKQKIIKYSGEHYIDCNGYTELVFRVDEWLDEIVEQIKEKK